MQEKCFSNLLFYQMDCLQINQSSYCSLNHPLLLGIEGFIVAIYIDDIINIGATYEDCLISTIRTIKLFLKLGFIIHPEKSSLQPSQEINFKGNVDYTREKKLLSLAKVF